MKKKRSLASCIQEFWPATILTPIFVIGEVAFDVLIPLMTGKLLDEGVKAGSMHHIAGLRPHRGGNGCSGADLRRTVRPFRRQGLYGLRAESAAGDVSECPEVLLCQH